MEENKNYRGTFAIDKWLSEELRIYDKEVRKILRDDNKVSFLTDGEIEEHVLWAILDNFDDILEEMITYLQNVKLEQFCFILSKAEKRLEKKRLTQKNFGRLSKIKGDIIEFFKSKEWSRCADFKEIIASREE